jgi:hypothetical protein
MKILVDGTVYEFDPDKFLNVELMAIEKATGMAALDWQDGLNRMSALAITGLVWVLRKRRGDVVAFDKIEFPMASIDLDYESPEDIEAGKARAEASASPPSDQADSSEPTTTTTS